MNLGDLWGHFFVSILAAFVIAVIGFFFFLWKRSVYGKFTEIEASLLGFETNFQHQIETATLLAAKNVEEAKRIAAEGIMEIKETVQREVHEIKDSYVPLTLCNSERDGCQGMLLARLEAINTNLAGKMDMIVKRQDRVIERMDRHMNGHGPEEK